MRRLFYNTLERALVRSQLAATLFVGILNIQASSKGVVVKIRTGERGAVLSFQHGRKIILVSCRHIVYSYDLINNFDYYFDIVAPLQEGDELIVDYSFPREHIIRASGEKFFFTSLAESPVTNDIYLEKGKLQLGDVVLDLGAYCGLSSISFSKAVGAAGKVYSFEPDQENYAALCKNIEMHGATNIVPINKGVWASSTKVSFQNEGNLGSSIVSFTNRRSSAHSVEMLSLDDFVKTYNVQKVDFIKMDIEGAEFEVIQSAKKMLSMMSPKIIIEPHIVNGQSLLESVCDQLQRIGYVTEILPQGELELPLIFAYVADEK